MVQGRLITGQQVLASPVQLGQPLIQPPTALQPLVQPPAGMPAGQPLIQPPAGMPAGQPLIQPPAGMPAGQPLVPPQMVIRPPGQVAVPGEPRRLTLAVVPPGTIAQMVPGQVPTLPQQIMTGTVEQVKPKITTVPLPPQTPGILESPPGTPRSPEREIVGVRLQSPIMTQENISQIELPTTSPIPGQGTAVYPMAIPSPDVKASVPLAQAYSAQQRAVQGRIDVDPTRIKAEKSKPDDGSYSVKDLRRIAGELNLRKSGTKKELAARIMEAITKP